MENQRYDYDRQNVCCKRVIHETCCYPSYYNDKDCGEKDYDKKCNCNNDFAKKYDDNHCEYHRCNSRKDIDKKYFDNYYDYNDKFDDKCEEKQNNNNDWNDEKKCCCRRQKRCGCFCGMFRRW